MKETAEEVARAMVAEADILAMLGNQPLSSLKVVEKLKGFAERIFNANVPAAVSPANLPPVNLPAGAEGTETGDGMPFQFQSLPPVNIPPRVHEQLEYWENQLVQLMAMRRYCARGDADLDALDCAIRALEHRHRNRARNALRRAGSVARGPINHEQPPTATNSSCLSVSVRGSSGKEVSA